MIERKLDGIGVESMVTGPLRDIDIRRALVPMLKQQHADEPGTLILDELGISSHSARIDIAVLNGMFAGYEIKSDVDSLTRLGQQSATYDLVLDEVTIVTGPRYADVVSQHAPAHWGIIIAGIIDNSVHLTVRRKPKKNPAKAYSKRALCMMLWREELVTVLKSYDAYRGLSARPKGALWDRLCEVATLAEIKEVVRETIKARGDWRSARPSGSYDGSPRRPAIV